MRKRKQIVNQAHYRIYLRLIAQNKDQIDLFLDVNLYTELARKPGHNLRVAVSQK